MALESCNIGLYYCCISEFFFGNRNNTSRGVRVYRLTDIYLDELHELERKEDTGLFLDDLDQPYCELMPINLVMFNKLETEE